MTITKINALLASTIVVTVAAVLLWVQHRAQVAEREENRALRQEIDVMAGENARLSNQVAAAAGAPAAASEQERELLKLRGEVSGLKRDLAEAARARAKAPPVQPAPEPLRTEEAEQAEQAKQLAIAKLNYAKGWMLAFWQYAQQHGGQLPSDFESAAPFAADALKGDSKLAPDQFEIVYKGMLNEIANPQSVIVIREKEAWQTADGGWARGYSFADGHSEIHKTGDGNFQPWESQHLAAPAVAQPGQ